MDNPIATSIPDLMASGAQIKGAAEDIGTEIPLVINPVVDIGADADALTTARNNYEQGKVVLANRRTTLLSVIMAVRVFIALGRDMLKPAFGNFYSEAFDILGFNGSLTIGMTAEELLPMLQAYKAFYVANVSRENVPANLTATQAQALYDQLNDAVNNVNLQKAVVQGLKVDRDNAATQMRKRIRDVFKELEIRLDPLDARWVAFGFNKPGALATPDLPANVSAILIGPTAVALKWDTSARAEYYRVWKRVHGATDDYVAVGSPADLDFTIENLPANATIDIVVTAINNGGESAYSEVVTITTR